MLQRTVYDYEKMNLYYKRFAPTRGMFVAPREPTPSHVLRLLDSRITLLDNVEFDESKLQSIVKALA